ncbi:N-acetylmuramoyl-L-alanine amidase family protein [Cohnella herbarum]|uniref:AMIN domain-containing protein n=1 Tax=Cohnella herbarum TaxID=2728023 RepID=A0A7Z2VG61_9BACL|nr:N-acetylmuramoyl-L-alanine amidase family protein [Cohnella herbarum]QJD82479.1 AMIN domain-containing protein [Cohnella herbarum]
MKKWLVLLFVVTGMLFLSAGIVSAAKAETLTPKLILDGKALQPQVPPIVVGQTVMIPVRIATSNLGYKVDYDNKKKQVTVSNGSKQLVMTLDQKTAYLDNKPQEMVKPPLLVSQNILIPLRFLGDSLGVQVFWDNQIKSAFLYSSNGGESGNNGENKPTDPPGGGLIGIVDPEEETPGGGSETVPPTTPEIPPVEQKISGNLYEVRYETDAVVLKYDGFTVPNAFKLDNPKRIVIDIPNTQYIAGFLPTVDFALAKEGKLPVTGHEALQSIRYSMFGETVKSPRFVLDLNQNWDYELVNDPTAGELRILLKKPQPDKSLYTVVLDAGHGGTDPGAISISKRPEKDFNLSVVLKVRDLLAGDERIKLVLTRSDDSFPTLDSRSALANSLKADLFISVHANSYTAATNGTETYYTREESKAFANLMHSLYAPVTGLKDNGVRYKSLSVTRKTTMPAILLEVGYLSSKIDEPQLWTNELQDRVAQAISTGIKQQLNLF